MAERTQLLEVKDARTLTMSGARLVVLKGADKGKALTLEREEVVVGTSPSADLVLTDPTVSGYHLSVRATSQGYLVRDLESRNGSRIDGRRFGSIFVEPGDAIELGATRLRLEATRDVVSLRLTEEATFGGLLGRSVAARRLFALLESVTRTDSTVLLSGETGTGKDLAAGAIHELGPRAQGPFVVFDCGAVNPNLIEAALFGHEAGAFTGAVGRRAGVFEDANGGTLFLDEIGELPKAQQVKLLRLLEARQVRRLGGAKTIGFDVRIIAATNRNLKEEINRGLFREDLYYRLNVIGITLPPLRERAEDIPLLAGRFWRELTGDEDAELPDGLLETFLLHRWPGNVRELRNRVERAFASKTTEITGLHPEAPTYRVAKDAAMAEFARSYLSGLMARAGGNVSEAARQAQMDRVHLIKLLRDHDLHPRGR
jgi:DNA-binding NtrC family response regulator